MKNEKAKFECASCGRTENETILLKYPITACFIDIEYDMDCEGDFVCLSCLEKDILELNEEKALLD